jgi:CelD/BcsL family acetyltransferase involved in cellulose biosynthesis
VVTIRATRDGSLVGVLPMMRMAGRLVKRVEFADLGTVDYAAPVVASAAAAAMSGDPDLSTAVRNAIGRFDLVRVNNILSRPRS